MMPEDARRVHASVPTPYAAAPRDATPAEPAAAPPAPDPTHAFGRLEDGLLRVLSHEFRHSLAPLRNAVDMLRLAGADRALVERATGIVDRQVSVLTRLVNDLTDLPRYSHEGAALERERVELAAAVRAVVDDFRHELIRKHQRLCIRTARRQVYVDADPIRLGQVLANLIGNAIKYTAPGGRIFVNALAAPPEKAVGLPFRAAGYAEIRCADSGLGIPSDMLERIFDLFDRGRVGDEHAQGLGIGLAVVKSLVAAHGGVITATSSGSGFGSEFSILWPRAEPPSCA